jgi:hypothetical protein
VYDAVGVRVDEVPITPEAVLRGLEERGEGRAARVGPRVFPAVSWPEPLRVPPPWEGGDGTAVGQKPEPSRRAAAAAKERRP